MVEQNAKPLPNPERAWHARREVSVPPREEIVARVGPIANAPRLLSGGLANLNLDLGDGRVLRMYPRDASSIPVEVALMRRAWRDLRVPRVLDHGDDFILMERVPHAPTLGAPEHGLALGRALAEVHAVRFGSAGFLAPGADAVARPFSSTTDAYAEHVLSLQHLEPAVRDAILVTVEADRAWLDADPVLLHGDFKASNLHVCDGAPLVLDWEYAYSGPALMDVGQLLRWGAPEAFSEAFAEGYVVGGGVLSGGWRRRAARADAVNLAGLLDRAEDGEKARVLTAAVWRACA